MKVAGLVPDHAGTPVISCFSSAAAWRSVRGTTMAEQILLGVDLGAESGRVMAGRWNGSRMTLEELHRYPNGPVQLAGTRRWDAPRLWQEI